MLQISCAFQQRVWNRQADGGVDRARDVAPERDPFAAFQLVRVGQRDGGEQRLGVGCMGVLVQLLAAADLDDLAQVHHGDAVTDVADYRQVVRDEQVVEVQLVLQRPRSRLTT